MEGWPWTWGGVRLFRGLFLFLLACHVRKYGEARRWCPPPFRNPPSVRGSIAATAIGFSGSFFEQSCTVAAPKLRVPSMCKRAAVRTVKNCHRSVDG
ncbi:hypothetical protein LX36DRAFT_650774 [Colletotrichum falcatum]|nr:hypothetical protein LX36DRAFT_650774 [Colletotrichum falcatum]